MPQSHPYHDMLANYKAPRWNDFPAIDLYMDQVVELLNSWLDDLYFDSKKPCITPSMINNYVKSSIVHPPIKKRYNNYHLAFLYVVMVLKQCFQLQDISEMIRIYYTMDHSLHTDTHFNTFAEVFESMLHQQMETGKIDGTYFENPNWQQELMVNVLQTVCCRLCSMSVLADVRKDHESEEYSIVTKKSELKSRSSKNRK